MILDPASLADGERLDADVCVIGSGAGGAVVARELAERGLRTVVLEEGRHNPSAEFTQREASMIPRLYRERASRATADLSVLVVQGRTLGGSTVPSFCLAFRPPAAILDAWEQRFGLDGVGSALMAPHFEAIERVLGVVATSEAELNANNARVRQGASVLGLRGRLPQHSRVACVGCGYCALGCAYDRKNDALTVLLPAAERAGAVLVPQCRADVIEREGGRVAGVRAVVGGDGQAPSVVTVRAKTVVLAAGAVASPQLWLRSGLPDPHRQVGRHLHLHPQVIVQAVFDEEIAGWQGVPQAFVIDHFLRAEPGGGGFLLTPIFAHPVTASALTPGLGGQHRTLMESYARRAMLSVALHDRSEGRIDIDDQGRASISYDLVEDDRADLVDGMQRASDVFFAAGARRVILPYTELVELEQPRDVAAIQRGVRANDPLMFSYQPHGTLRMSATSSGGVAASSGAAHEVPGLWIADASLFPTALGVPPQLAVMAFAARVASRIA